MAEGRGKTGLTDEDAADEIMVKHPARGDVRHTPTLMLRSNVAQGAQELLEEGPCAPCVDDDVEVLQ